jgi:hypothetical protein
MDALRNSKKISLLAVAILFLFSFFTLILDAPRNTVIPVQVKRKMRPRQISKNAFYDQKYKKIKTEQSIVSASFSAAAWHRQQAFSPAAVSGGVFSAVSSSCCPA